MSGLSRRNVILGAVGASVLAGCGRLPWQAQPPKIYRIGFLSNSPRFFDEFREAMHALDYVESGNAIYEYREASFDQSDQLRDLASELVGLPVDVIVAGGTPSALMAMRATHTIPIVFLGVIDPIEAGLVPSFAQPGGNVTGTSLMATQLSEKRLEHRYSTGRRI